MLTVTHKLLDDKINIEKEYAQSLLVSLGFVNKDDTINDPLINLNKENIVTIVMKRQY